MPAGSAGAVLQHDSGLRQLVPQGIGAGEILAFPSVLPLSDQGINLLIGKRPGFRFPAQETENLVGLGQEFKGGGGGSKVTLADCGTGRFQRTF